MNNDWFTVKAVDSRTYAISEYKHWEKTHCYLLLGESQAVLIDSGLGVSNIKAIVDGLTELPVLVMSTHAHWDHIGGHRLFSHWAVHEAEYSWLNGKFPLPLPAVKQQLTKEGCEFPDGFDLNQYEIFSESSISKLHDSDVLELGDRKLVVIHTPGHSPGHCCYYDPDNRYLFSGDLLYLGCLDMYYPSTDPEVFFDSIRKIQKLNMNHIFPGHFSLEIPISLADQVSEAFSELKSTGNLRQGAGIFDFGQFSLHL